MKWLCCFLCFLWTAALSQNSSVIISTAGIGEIKIGMKKAELEKLIGQKLTLKHLAAKKDNAYQDTFRVQYKGIEIEVMLQNNYIENDKYEITVGQLRSNNPSLKTRSGIAIGDDKLKVVSTYENYLLHLSPDYENDYKTKSKTKSTIWLFSDDSNVIIFYLENNKVTAFSVMMYEGC